MGDKGYDGGRHTRDWATGGDADTNIGAATGAEL
jgi:hypothetical protein